MLKISFEVKIYKNIRISDTTPNSVSSSTLLCVTSNMINSLHKMWQTSYLVLKPLHIQTLREKSERDMAYCVPLSKKVRGHVPRVPHQIAPMRVRDSFRVALHNLFRWGINVVWYVIWMLLCISRNDITIFDDVVFRWRHVSMMSPCSLNRSTVFLLWLLHSTVLVLGNDY